MRLFKHPLFVHSDKGVWVSDFIQEFEKHTEFEYHILAMHNGMRNKMMEFDINGIHYHFMKSDHGLLFDTLNAKFHISERNNYRHYRRLIHQVIDRISPEIVVLCGAENPEYSLAALDVEKYPVYCLLQTVLNNSKLMKYTKEACGYRADCEKKVFQKVNYFGTSSAEYYSLYININPKALCLSINFPSHNPPKFPDVVKEYDFVFFGRMTKNKGVEDVIKAMGVIIKYHPDATLCLIGSASPEYDTILHKLAEENNVSQNIIFKPRYELLDNLYAEVQKSHIALLPGITAFNSTVREAMLMGMPTIVYDIPIVESINAEKMCLLAARMEDVYDLAEKMRYAMDNPLKMREIATNGSNYAYQQFSNSLIGDKITANFEAIINNYYKGIPIKDDLLLSYSE